MEKLRAQAEASGAARRGGGIGAARARYGRVRLGGVPARVERGAARLAGDRPLAAARRSGRAAGSALRARARTRSRAPRHGSARRCHPSYKDFLKTSNGWRNTGLFIPRLLVGPRKPTGFECATGSGSMTGRTAPSTTTQKYPTAHCRPRRGDERYHSGFGARGQRRRGWGGLPAEPERARRRWRMGGVVVQQLEPRRGAGIVRSRK